MLQIHSDLKEILVILNDPQHKATEASYQNASIRFRGLVDDAAEQSEVYQQWSQQYLVDVNDETGEVIKLHESTQELKADIEAFIKLIERIEQYSATN